MKDSVNMKKSILFSVLIHAILLLFLISLGGDFSLNANNGSGKFENGGNKDNNHEIVNKDSNPVEIKVIDSNKSKDLVKQAKSNNKKSDCEKWFGGIGVTYNSMTGIISAVHEGYPAHKAGIQTGDILLNSDVEGEVGESVFVYIKDASGQNKMYTLVREKICVTPKMKESTKNEPN